MKTTVWWFLASLVLVVFLIIVILSLVNGELDNDKNYYVGVAVFMSSIIMLFGVVFYVEYVLDQKVIEISKKFEETTKSQVESIQQKVKETSRHSKNAIKTIDSLKEELNTFQEQIAKHNELRREDAADIRHQLARQEVALAEGLNKIVESLKSEIESLLDSAEDAN